jgi:single-strand DNA-binding protein
MMARSVNKVILIGNLGRDAETKFTRSGTAVTNFSVATTRNWKNGNTEEWVEETNWTNVVLWDQQNVASYLTKGKQVYIEGRLQTRSYEDKGGRKVYVTEVIANEVLLLGGRMEPQSDAAEPPQRTRNGRPDSRSRAQASEEELAGVGITDDDAPW